MATTNRYANGHRRRQTRKRLIAMSDGICPLCGRPLDVTMPPSMCSHPLYPVIDEKVPVARGGKMVIENQWLVHRECNGIKGAKLLSELRLRKGSPPNEPVTTRDWGI